MAECRVQLRRDRVETAWGVRLQGGQDFSSPLVVQRVFSGSPADGQLQRGDVLVSINNRDVSRMQQKQAEEFIKATGTTMSMVVKRSAGGLQLNNVHQYANEPVQASHPQMHDGGSDQFRPQPPTSLNASDGVSQPMRYGQPQQQNIWAPSPSSSYPAASTLESPQRGGYGGFDQQQQQQQQQSVTPTYQPVSFQKPATPNAGGYNAANQFSTADSHRQETPRGGAGPSWRGTQPQQPSHIPVQHESSNQVYSTAPSQRYLDEMPTQPVQPTVISQQQDDDEGYEVKSVREIKAMFNKASKPVGQPQRSSNKPIKFQPKQAPAVSHKQSGWNTLPAAGKQVSYQQSRAFSPPSQPVEQRGSVLSPQDPYSGRGWPTLSPPPAAQPVTGLLKPKQVSPALKPGAGSSYQGIVTVTPPKKVQQGSKSSGSSGAPAKKKKVPTATLR